MEKRYIKSFQGLRCIAALMVFLEHAKIGLKTPGTFAVSLFFILSGFLAQMQYIEMGGGNNSKNSLYKSCKYNLLKNLKKLMPLHLLALVITIPLGFYNRENSILELVIKLFANATLLWSWFDFAANPFNGVSWYLSTTVLFAALSPIITKSISSIKKSKSIILILAGIFVIQFSLAFVCEELLLGRWLIYVFPPIRLLDCIAGCLIFKLADLIKTHMKSVGSLLCLSLFIGIGGGCYALTFFFAHQVFQTAVWSIPSLGIVTFLYVGEGTSKPIEVVFGNKIFQWGGAITFEFFLFHETFLRYLRGFYKIFFAREQDIVLVVGALVLSVLWSVFLHYILGRIKKRKTKSEPIKS